MIDLYHAYYNWFVFIDRYGEYWVDMWEVLDMIDFYKMCGLYVVDHTGLFIQGN